MEYCDSCKENIEKMHFLTNQVHSLKNQLQLMEMQIKSLRDENSLLKSNIKVPNKQRRQNDRTKDELQQCYKEIEKLKTIIQHKDLIIESQVRCDIISTKTESNKKVKL